MSIREANALKGSRRCLKCGKTMWTDRCHRICPKCSHANEHLMENRATLAQDLLQVVRQLPSGGSRWGERVLGGVVAYGAG
jgi:cytochrome c-type biogenesis protein CcmH/NrfF